MRIEKAKTKVGDGGGGRRRQWEAEKRTQY